MDISLIQQIGEKFVCPVCDASIFALDVSP
jgi:hypothetical protein